MQQWSTRGRKMQSFSNGCWVIVLKSAVKPVVSPEREPFTPPVSRELCWLTVVTSLCCDLKHPVKLNCALFSPVQGFICEHPQHCIILNYETNYCLAEALGHTANPPFEVRSLKGIRLLSRWPGWPSSADSSRELNHGEQTGGSTSEAVLIGLALWMLHHSKYSFIGPLCKLSNPRQQS